MENETKTIQERVQEAIASGAVTMKPKWHFVLKAILFALGILIVSLTLVFLTSFVVFILRQSGVLFVPLFGMHGIYEFIVSLPWVLVVLFIAFVVVLELLVRHYSFAYRRPLVFSIVGIFVVVAVGAASVARTPFHRDVFEFSERAWPMANRMYRHFEEPQPPHVFSGKIIAPAEGGFIMMCRQGDVYRVLVPPETILANPMKFTVGQMVVVFGSRMVTSVTSFGIRILGGE